MPVVVLKEYEKKSEAWANLFVLVGQLPFTTVVFNKRCDVLNRIGGIGLILHALCTYLFVTPLPP